MSKVCACDHPGGGPTQTRTSRRSLQSQLTCGISIYSSDTSSVGLRRSKLLNRTDLLIFAVARVVVSSQAPWPYLGVHLPSPPPLKVPVNHRRPLTPPCAPAVALVGTARSTLPVMIITSRTVSLSRTAFSALRHFNSGMPTTLLYSAPRMAASSINCTSPRPLLRAHLPLNFGVYRPSSSLFGLVAACYYSCGSSILRRHI